MSQNSNEQLPLPEAAILVFFGAGVAIVLFILVGLWALVGLKYAFIAFLVVVVLGVVAWLLREADHHRMKRAHHKQEMHNQTHHRDLAALALDRGYSVQLEHPDGRKMLLTSPLTIPGAPVTIKELNWGLPQIAAPSTLPDKVMAIDVMRKWSLTPQNLFLALGKGSKEYACTLEGLMHVAHDAPTGLGKTAQWKAEIIQLLKLNVQVILANPHFAPVDKKGNDWRPIGQAIEQQGWIELQPGLRIPGLIRKYETIVNMLKWLSVKEIDRRFMLQAQGDYSYMPLYIFLDEWPSIVNRFPAAGDYLVDVLQRGRAVDVCVDTNAQGFLQEDVDLKGSARENFNTAYHMGGSAHSGAKLLDMPVKDYNEVLRKEQVTLGQGIALLRNNESVPQAELVRLPYANNDYVYYMLGRAETWMLPEFRQRNGNRNVPGNISVPQDFRNAQEQPVKPFYDSVPDVPENEASTLNSVSSEEQEQIINLAKAGVPRREMCLAMGKGKAYYSVIKQVLDQEGL